MLGKRHSTRRSASPEAPSDTAASSSPVPCSCISGMSSRATNGKGDEDGGEHDARQREEDLDAVALEARADQRCQPEQQDIDEAGDDRRDREGQVDQGEQERLALELEFGDRPGRHHAEDEVERHRDAARRAASGGWRTMSSASPKRQDRTRPSPCGQCLAKTATSGSPRKSAINRKASAISRIRGERDRGRRGAQAAGFSCAHAAIPGLQAWMRIDDRAAWRTSIASRDRRRGAILNSSSRMTMSSGAISDT
jgi:hypothetical protein